MEDTWNTNETVEPVLAKTKEETDRKCPDCGGTMDFDPATGGLTCPYCGRQEEIVVQEERRSAVELDFETAEETGNCNWGVEKKVVICKSCGAESVYDALEIASECPYCGSNQVMEEKADNTLAPGGVCPFEIEKKEAGERFKKWIKGKWFCPKDAKQSAKPEAFQGVYIPAWTFDAETYSSYSGEYGIERSVRSKDGKSTETVTDWYHTRGNFNHRINDELIYGSERYNSDILNEILPFQTESNVEYKPEYVAGFAAERYTIGIKDAWEKAKTSIKRSLKSMIEKKIERDHNADKVANVQVSTEYSDVTYKYLLLPVWISSYTYKGKTYQFMVNGQTGMVGGKSPISWIRVLLAVLIVILIFALVYFLFM